MNLVNPRRVIAGFTTATENFTPTQADLEQTGKKIREALNQHPGVIATAATPTFGKYGDFVEPSLNIEIIAKEDFDPAVLMEDFALLGKAHGQDSVFLSRVLDPAEFVDDSRPQVEIAFGGEVDQKTLEAVAEELRLRIGGGFTVVTDPRTGKPTGFRQQYIPEYEGVRGHKQEHIDWAYEGLYDALVSIDQKFGGIVKTSMLRSVDTVILGNGGIPYDEIIRQRASVQGTAGSTAGTPGGTAWPRQPNRRVAEGADPGSGRETGQRGVRGRAAGEQATLPDRNGTDRPRSLTGASRGDRPSPRPPSVRTQRLWHFSGASRKLSGIERKYAGTAGAGQERSRLVRRPDGTVDPDSAMVHVYLPGSQVEPTPRIGPVAHEIGREGGYNFLDNGSGVFDLLLRKAEIESLRTGVPRERIVGRYAVEAGYDGIVYQTGEKRIAQLYADVPASEILSVQELDPTTNRKLRDPYGEARLRQEGGPVEDPTRRPRGQVTFRDGQAVVEVFAEGEVSTVVHEVGHVLRRLLVDIDPELARAADETYGVRDGNWGVDAEEAFARDLERYIIRGEVGENVQQLRPLFERLKEMFRDIYESVLKSAKAGDLEIPTKTRDIFDNIFGDQGNKFDPTSPKPSNRAPNRPVPYLQDIRTDYLSTAGLRSNGSPEYLHIDIRRASAIADAYDEMKHNPKDPLVAEAYEAFAKETMDQYRHLQEQGIRVIFTRKDPYKGAQEMAEDVARNKRIYVFLTEPETMPADHPLAKITGEVVTTPEGEYVKLTYNDIFRAVHDLYGHAAYGYQFGARGEESAWLTHSLMYGPKARMAMTSETRGQNNWVNAGKHLKRADGTLPNRGDPDFVPLGDRPFAQQKAGLLPAWTWEAKGGPTNTLRQSLLDDILEAASKGVALDEAISNGFNLHINYARINTSEDVKVILAEVEEVAQKLIDQKIGKTQTMEQVALEAAKFAEDPGKLLSDMKKNLEAFNRAAPSLVALRSIHAGLGKDAYETATQILKAGRNVERDEHLRKKLASVIKAMSIVDDIRGQMQKSMARAVQSGNIKVGDNADVSADLITKAMRGLDDPAAKKALEALSEESQRALEPVVEVLTTMPPNKLVKVAKAIKTAGDMGQQGRMVDQIRRNANVPSLWEIPLELWKAGLLSGTRTFAVNGISGGLQTVVLPAFRAVGGAMSLDMGEFRRGLGMYAELVGTAKDMLAALVMGSDFPANPRRAISMLTDESITPLTRRSAVENDRRALSSNTLRERGLGRVADATIPGTDANAVDTLGAVTRTPFRINMMFEEFWSQLNYVAFVRQKAKESSGARAIWDRVDITPDQKAAEYKQYVDKYVADAFEADGTAAADPTGEGQWFHRDAVRFAQTVNFTQDLMGGTAEAIGKLRDFNPYEPIRSTVFGVLLPFHKAPANILRDGRRMLPGAGFLQRAGEIRRQRGYGFTEEAWEKNIRNGQAMVGSAVGVWIASLAVEGTVTGGGPTNPAERARLMESGWLPYSFAFTDENGRKSYVAYNRMDPFGMTMGLIADAVEVLPYLEEHRQDEIAAKLVGSIANNIGGRSYLRSMHETIRALFQAQQYGPSYARNMISTLVPNFLGSAVIAEDEQSREARTIIEAIKRRLPGYSKTLPPRRTLLGEPVTPIGGWLPFVDPQSSPAKYASPIAFSREADDIVVQEIADLRLNMALPSRKIAGVIDMTRFKSESGQTAYDRLQELTGSQSIGGRRLHQALKELIEDERYQAAPPITGNRDIDRRNPRVLAVQRVIRGYRNAARQKVMQEYPELRDAYTALLKAQGAQSLDFLESLE
jgi:hypothetical protein